MYMLLLLANVASVTSNAQEGHYATAVFSGAMACACMWWAWEARNDPSEHVVARRLAEGGED